MNEHNINSALPSMNNTQSALNIQQISSNAINLNNLSSYIGTVNALNNVISNMYGVKVKWFRAAPVDRAKDVIFQEYTLMNVADCGFDINVIYDDTGYDEAALQYNMMGIQYQIPLTLSVSVDVWNAATNNDGTLPQKKDIVYFPHSNKLYQVVSMNPVKTVASQITSYKCNLSIYKNERSVHLNSDLAETIENYTESVNSIFGEDIKNEIEDIVSDKQTSQFNSSATMNRYKQLGFDKNDNRIIMDNLISNGHLISKNYYNNTNEKLSFLVKYMNSNDTISSDDRFYSIIFRLKNNEYDDISLTEIKVNKNNKIYKSDKKINSKFLTINKGLINLFGIYDNGKIKIDNHELENYPDNWNLLGNYSINKKQYNLLKGYNNNEVISIDIITNSLILTINSKIINIPLDINLHNDIWYNLSINLSKNGNVRIYKLNSNIEEVFYKEFNIKDWKDLYIANYEISNSDIDIRNIRLFDQRIDDKDKQLINLISEFSNNSSKLIICDNINELEKQSYYGEQR